MRGKERSTVDCASARTRDDVVTRFYQIFQASVGQDATGTPLVGPLLAGDAIKVGVNDRRGIVKAP